MTRRENWPPPVPAWYDDIVREHDIKRHEAIEMLNWAFSQVHIAAALIHACGRVEAQDRKTTSGVP